MATTRAKFLCQTVTQYSGDLRSVRLTAITGTSEENKTFWKYTPNGTIEMSIDNPPASALFEPGKAYYVDFSEAEN